MLLIVTSFNGTEMAFYVLMGRLKMRDMNLRHQFARVEIAGYENAGPIYRGGKCGKS